MASLTVLQSNSLDGVDHRDEAIRPGRGQIILKADLVDETEIVSSDLFRSTTGIDADQERNYALCDDSIAVRPEVQFSVLKPPIQPNP